jgi:hypothetical protein
VYQVVQSDVIDISQFTVSRNIQAHHNVQFITVQEDVGSTNEFLKQRIEHPAARRTVPTLTEIDGRTFKKLAQ